MNTRIASTALLTAISVCAQSIAYSDTSELMAPDASAYSGQWTYERGMFVCKGYLTRNPAEAHCEAQPPSDWQSFEYEGKTYYVHRLSAR